MGGSAEGSTHRSGSASRRPSLYRAAALGGYRGFAPDALIFGDAEQVADRFRALAAIGYTDVIVRSMVQDQPQALASLRRLRDVREAVSDA